MASVAAPRLTGRSLLGRVALTLRARAGRPSRPSRVRAFAADHAGTLAALAAADEGLWRVPWHLGPVAGPLGLCAAILIAELKIRG